MAVELITAIQTWIGLSTDTKPTSGVRVGSTFQETNTGKRWLYISTGWIEDLSLIYAAYEAYEAREA